jgi:two-component system response regulator QseB
MRILVVEDAPHVRQYLCTGLKAEGHEAIPAGDLSGARAILEGHGIEFVIVDRGLPDGDGLDLIRELRRNGSTIPAVCLTGRDRVDERIEGLRSGVDDYLSKPFSFEELLARIDVIRRRAGLSPFLVAGPLTIEVEARKVRVADQPIELTAREFDLLLVLVRNQGTVMSRARLLDLVWGVQHDPRTNVVDVYIRYIRNKLGLNLIRTVRGVGYTFESEPEEADR